MRSRTEGRLPRLLRRTTGTLLASVLLAGLGPGAMFRPCPKHAPAPLGVPDGLAASAVSQEARAGSGHPAPVAAMDHGAPASSGSHASSAAHAGHSSDPSDPHSGGPCDCLSHCVTCCAPAPVHVAWRAEAPPTLRHIPPTPPDLRPAADPAHYLAPEAQPPPA